MRYNKFVKAWLITGCILIFFQIVIGGITRISGSGLSITKWEIVTGTIPPLNHQDWMKEFDLYKQTPQYKKVNVEMDLDKFKFIYFWEYFHRLWARLMGFVFLLPFVFFLLKRWIDKRMVIKLVYVICFAALAAVFGWIMVASGLVNRPWVNAYKLSIHLGIALLTFGFLLWTVFYAFRQNIEQYNNERFRKLTRAFFVFICIQIFFGAIVSGMRASLYYPTWPDIGGALIPDVLFDGNEWSIDNIVHYDTNTFMPALIHVLHRTWGYFLYFFGIYYCIQIFRYPFPKTVYIFTVSFLVLIHVQVLLGILTLVNSVGSIPLFYGVMHQAIAIFILSIALYMLYIFRLKPTADNG